MAHAPEVNNVPQHQSQTFRFARTLSRQEVALGVLHHAGWSPECARPHTSNLKRLLPDLPTTVHFTINEELALTDEYRCVDGARHLLKRVHVMAGSISEGAIYATQVVVWVSGRVEQSRGTVHGKHIFKEQSAYTRKAVVLHALQTAQQRIQSKGSGDLQHITIEAGDYQTVNGIEKWLDQGRVSLESEAASEIMSIMNELSTTYGVPIAISPLSIPEQMENGARTTLYQQIFLMLTDHYWQFVLPALPETWVAPPPALPGAAGELRGLAQTQHLTDERRLIDLLGNLDSESASIISYLDLSREAIQEALTRLRDNRSHQATLLSILAATRFRMLTKGGLVPTTCRKSGCGKRDSFWHLLTCCQLMTSVECGPYAVPFLVYLAQKAHATGPPCPRTPLPNPA